MTDTRDRPTVIDPLTTDPARIDPDLKCFFLGGWLGILELAAREAVRQGKTPEEAGRALAVAVGAAREQVTT